MAETKQKKRHRSRLHTAKSAAKRRYSRKATRPGTSHVVDTDPRVNVVGVGIGSKLRGGKVLPRKVIHLYVVHKLPKNVVPKRHLLPSSIAGVPTDVIETGVFRANATGRARPARPGCSIGATRGSRSTFGTFGALVRRTDDDGGPYLLSCNHVLTNWGRFAVGADVLQPSNRDGGDVPDDDVAVLKEAFPLTSSKNVIDAAVALVADTASVDPRVTDPIGRLASSSPIDATEKMKVEKVGRSTDHTTGIVIATAADFLVSSGDPDIGSFPFTNQILIQGSAGAFSALGDSGALVVDSGSRRATGLLCASSDTQPITSACHMRDVLRLMQLVLVV
jgi:hypothetical protein